MIHYTTSIEGIIPAKLEGFCVGWHRPLTPEKLLQILSKSTHAVLAIDGDTGCVIGFINAVGDGTFSAYIPLLEVLPDYQNRGIGGELVRRMLRELDAYTMIDLACDSELQPFYERFGMVRGTGMMIRNYK